MQKKSKIQSKQNNEVQIKNKSQLVKMLNVVSPSPKQFRIITDKNDARSQQHEVAVLEQINGKLSFIIGAPTLSLAFSFFGNAINDGRVQ